ncbi:unnamed protein product [Musa acuminata subsp. malaccensis]|uniref:(wild Malaysian banana) hypothetical protein n=1 Tax=Musa acuminata subsp. malaccensis TaxID=214687 RepID=A0A8D7ADL0_MUSAM|nr:unnamed protein product [Musa acuminata subsp. malaccensis]
MMMSSSQRNAYSYGDALYWDARYLADGSASFDWYQRYSALRPFVRKYVPVSAGVLMVGCGNAVMSEDMVKDGYIDIMNIDISSVVTEMMRKKYTHIPQLRYMQMDVRDMSFFDDESFDCVIDKGTKLSFYCYCGVDATLSASRMLEEVNRLLRPGGIYMLITYGDPSVRIPRLNQPGCSWNIILYIIPRPGFQSHGGCSSQRSIMEPVPLTKCGQLPAGFVLEDPDSHYIYVCEKEHGLLGIAQRDCSSALK